MEKPCSKCFIVKSLDQYSKGKGKLGVRSSCKTCRKVEHELNREKRLLQMKEYRKNNIEKVKQLDKQYQIDNKEDYSAYQKEWRINNRNKINSHTKKRKENDSLYKLRCNLSGLIYISINRQGYSKKSKTYKLLGADFETVQKHLIESAIKNYGVYDPNFTYHIDHIKPCALAKNEEELIALQHYTNLQYLTPIDNIRKGKKEI